MNNSPHHFESHPVQDAANIEAHRQVVFDQRNNAANLVLQGEVERTAIAVVRILGGVVQPRPKFL